MMEFNLKETFIDIKTIVKHEIKKKIIMPFLLYKLNFKFFNFKSYNHFHKFF